MMDKPLHKIPLCRYCETELNFTMVDLGMSPLCESYIGPEQRNQMEPFYPLHVYVCRQCFLVQLEEYVSPEHIFREYAYFSSYSDTWLEHARNYSKMVAKRLELNDQSFVVELASNDGYLLQNFLEMGFQVLGIEPAANVAAAAVSKGVPTLVEFFGDDLAQKLVTEGKAADLIIGNNVLAQVPNINDFVAGMKTLLKPDGVITMEFPHLMCLMEGNQFDTIYHEHFSYFSLITVNKIFAAHNLTVFDVEELSTHGGSLRIYACHSGNQRIKPTTQVAQTISKEQDAGYAELQTYASFGEQVKDTKRKLLSFLIKAKSEGKVMVGYGAPGKGNTLLNYCGIRTDFLDYTVDRNPYKQGKFLPGTHIPILQPDKIRDTKPDYVMILPWNFKDEIMEQISYIREWGGKFIVPIPEAQVYP